LTPHRRDQARRLEPEWKSDQLVIRRKIELADADVDRKSLNRPVAPERPRNRHLQTALRALGERREIADVDHRRFESQLRERRRELQSHTTCGERPAVAGADPDL